MQGLDALGYSEHIDYDLVESTNPAFQKAIVRVNVFRDHRQVDSWNPQHDAISVHPWAVCSVMKVLFRSSSHNTLMSCQASHSLGCGTGRILFWV